MTEPQLTCRTYAYVSITGPGTHETISETLGLKPHEARNIGDINHRNGRPYTHMRWAFRSGLDDTHSFEEHIHSLFLMFHLKSESLKSLWVEYDICLHCVGCFPPSAGPGIHLDREVVRQAAQLGMAIDCDFYFTDDEGHAGWLHGRIHEKKMPAMKRAVGGAESAQAFSGRACLSITSSILKQPCGWMA